jgi:histone H3/H4
MNTPGPSGSTYGPTTAERIYRRIMRQSVAAICNNYGINSVESRALDLLTQMAASHLAEACRSTKLLCDHAGRTVVTPQDVFLGLLNMGTDMDELGNFLGAVRDTAPMFPAPARPSNPITPSPMHIGDPPPRPAHIPSFLPPFPDAYTYIRTEISGDPDPSYANGRELSATNKRNVENSLKNYMLGIHPTISLFSQYEEELRKEAKTTLERERNMRIQSRIAARNRERLERDLNASGDLLDDILEDGESQKPNDIATDDTNVMAEIEEEDIFTLKETESSYVRRKIPAYCQVLEPFAQTRPYLSALLSDEALEEEHNNQIVNSREKEEPAEPQDSDAGQVEESFTVLDNPYFNPPVVNRRDNME